MDVPQPPQDEELKNIIQKLAVFVARNGPEFEAMTKVKQQGNPMFAFLYGGEYYNYYMYRVTTEQAVLKHKSQQQQANMGMNQGGQMMNFGGQQQQQSFPPQQQQHQRFPTPLFDQPPGHMQNNNQPPPRHISRFDRGPGQMQNFERPQMRMPFQNPQQNFENLGAFERRNQSQGQGGGPQGPEGSGNFDFNPSGPGGFDNRSQTNRGGFESRGPSSGRFDIRPPGNFDSPGSAPVNRRFDVGPSGNFESSGPSPPIGRGRFDNNSSQPPIGGRFDMPPGNYENSGLSGFSQNFPPSQQQNVPRVNSGPPPHQTPSPIASSTSSANLSLEIETLKAQKQSLEEQIKQSEQNLAGQHQVLMTQQQQQIDESIRIVQDAEIKQLSAELNINLSELDAVLQPIIESCTKDSISGGKAWIFTHTSTPRHYQLLSLYLLRKTTDPEAPFNRRLHIIYLVNDVLHHCMRKGAEDLQQVLEAMVIPMFCHAKVKETGNEENLTKLNKLLALWENKSQYVSPIAVEKLRDSSNTWLEYHGELLKRHAVVVSQIAQNIQKTYEGYQAQHQMFCQHVLQNIKTIDQKMQQLIIQQQFQLAAQQQQQQQQQINLRNSLPPLMGGPQNLPPPGLAIPGSQPSLGQAVSSSGPPTGPITTGYPGHVGPPQAGAAFRQNSNANIPPPGVDHPPGVPILDISRPPPGFQQPISEKDLMPALPYYELPAGLMVPLVKPEDDNYKPIDPKAIRLPPPCPPSEKLLQAVEAFYGPPSHERPRDSEGWERLGLYEYFKSKNLARKQKEDDIREGRRDKSRSPSPIRRDSSPSGRSPPRRRYHSKSPTPIRRRRSRSRSPTRRKNRRRSRSPGRRSPTPPSFGMPGLGMDKKLDESNKGHQLLKKMGWGGSGLGANEQGIEAPISGGEIREKKDLYRGVGISMNDPFESYRKSKGQAFVERMRQRAEDRP